MLIISEIIDNPMLFMIIIKVKGFVPPAIARHEREGPIGIVE